MEPRYLLGNIRETHLLEMVASPAAAALRRRTSGTRCPRYCRECPVRFACHGECPRNRFIETPDGEPGLNYLCAGYLVVLHPRRPTDAPHGRTCSGAGRHADEVMGILAAEESALREAVRQAGRNDPCPCGSGRKTKICHGA